MQATIEEKIKNLSPEALREVEEFIDEILGYPKESKPLTEEEFNELKKRSKEMRTNSDLNKTAKSIVADLKNKYGF
jgi:hypothetical protein